MDVKELEQLDGPPEMHWYYWSKFELLAAAVRHFAVERAIDIGSGSGVFARLLLQHTPCREVVCVDPAYSEEREERLGEKTLRFCRAVPPGADAQLALLMDVLEHVDDDAGLLAGAARELMPGTPVFVTVPAFAFLWSAHDVYLEHRRRYTAASLGSTIERAGLHADWIRYYYGAVLPVAATIRLMTRRRDPAQGSDLRPVAPWLDRALRGLMRLERRTVFPFNTLGGLSVVALARA